MRGKTGKLPERLSTVQLIVLFYLSAVIISTVLIGLPITLKSSAEISFIDALFTAVSATTNAGFDITGESLIPFANGLFCPICQYGAHDYRGHRVSCFN